MEFESGGLSREEIRKKRRQKERKRALLVLGGVAAAVCLVLGIGIAALVHTISSNHAQKQEAAKQAMLEQQAAEKETAAALAEAKKEEELAAQKAEEMETAEAEPTDAPEETDAASDEVTDTDSSDETASDQTDAENQEDAEAVLEEMVASQIAGMSIEQKVAALFFVTPEQLLGIETPVTEVGSSISEKLNQYPVGGIVLKEGNITSAEGLSEMVSNLQVFTQNSLFIGISDEGGEDSPFITSGISENVIASQKETAESLGNTGAYSAGISLGSELKQFGFNVDFAPLADVSLKDGSIAEQKGFGKDAATNAELARNVVKGLTDQSIFAGVKYFPGYGDATQEGNSGQIISQRTRDDLKEEYAPYQEAIDAGAKFLMISHVSLPKIRGDKRPASLSPEIITDIVREEWGYDGIVITDYMDKSCIYQKYTYAEAAVGAIEAGADMILSTKNFAKSYNGILDAVKKGQLTEERIDQSLTRIYKVKFASKVAGY
ncbi:MAG: glycoside hydrolase family 3 N-terminal domain-containing protein [Lachnospiraceae bacterium]|nr:glycoside hydrolase family 3 N-terminal domain-containing protein [Lachnospiraceae bacterium]